jgi:hypothetical protein
MISMSVASRGRCELPSRPGVQVVVGGRLVRARQGPFVLGAENVPRRVIGPGRGAWALVRFANYCGAPGSLALRITIGGRSVTRAIPNAASPVCGSRASSPSLGVSLFVRR